jgi:hypothetical protein
MGEERDKFVSRRQERLAGEYTWKAESIRSLALQITGGAGGVRVSLLLEEANRYLEIAQKLRADAVRKRQI